MCRLRMLTRNPCPWIALALVGMVVATGPARTQDKKKATAPDSADHRAEAVKYRIALEQLRKARSELVQAQADRRRTQVELEVLQARDKALAAAPPPVSETALEEALAADKLVTAMSNRQVEMEEALESMRGRTSGGDKNPTILRQMRDLDALRASIEARRKRLRPQLTEQLRERTRRELQTAMVPLQERILVLDQLEKVLTEEVKKLSAATRPTEETRHFLQGEADEGVLQRLAQLEEDVRQLRNLVEEMRKTPPREREKVTSGNP